MPRPRETPSKESLVQALDYDPETGIFTWKTGQDQGRPAGSTAGSRGYLRITLRDANKARRGFLGHRLAWKIMTGEEAPDHIDHRNGNTGDNRWDNIRGASHAENMRNKKRKKDSLTGFKGVGIEKSGRFNAHIGVAGKKVWLGSYTTPEEAHAAYCAAARNCYGEFANVG